MPSHLMRLCVSLCVYANIKCSASITHDTLAVSTRPICMTVLYIADRLFVAYEQLVDILAELFSSVHFIIVITVINNHIAVYACIYRRTSPRSILLISDPVCV